jgi:uracil-DNA glycosylase
MIPSLPPSWHAILAPEFDKPYWGELTSFIRNEYSNKQCFPEEKDIFRAYELTPFESVKVVILGQDPYHTAYDPGILGLSQDLAPEQRFLPTQE